MVTLPAVVKPLKPKHQRFVDEYMVDRNATQAYIRAGYSPRGANTHAARLVANGPVSAEIARRVEEYSRAAGIDKVWVLERMKALIDACLPDLFNADGELLHPRDWPEHMQRVVDKVKVVQKRTGTVVIDSNGTPILVPMYTKEVSLEAKGPMLAKLLDWVAPEAPKDVAAPVNNTQVNIDKLLLLLDSPLPPEAE